MDTIVALASNRGITQMNPGFAVREEGKRQSGGLFSYKPKQKDETQL